MLIDTHCHLDAAEFDADRDEVVRSAMHAGVGLILVPSVERGNFQAVADLAARHRVVRYTLGIHPLCVDRASDADIAVLRETVTLAMTDPCFIGIGEIGLDHFIASPDPERQTHFFVEQLRIAREFDLPVILHVRRAQDAVLKQCRRIAVRGGIAHAFNGSEQQAGMFIDLGFALGFGGAMTYERALQIRRLALAFDPQAYVLETDSPDIAPAWRYKQRNAPHELPRIASVFAHLRNQDPDTVIGFTHANAHRVLPRLGLSSH
jgi:TatD DNase family protein